LLRSTGLSYSAPKVEATEGGLVVEREGRPVTGGASQEKQYLERGRLTVANGIALAAAAMAPVIAVVLNAPAAGPAAGGALPLSFLLAFIACLLVGNTVVQFARQLPSSGSFYTYNSNALGSAAGFFTGWLFFIGYAVLAPGLFTAVGAFASDYVSGTFGVGIPWWIFSLFAMAVVVGLSIRSIQASARVDMTLLVIEMIVFLILAIISIAVAGDGNTVAVFSPTSSPEGLSGVGLGVVFGILSFVGFDAAATLGEESRNPRRAVPLAVGGALISIGLFYVFMMYALSAGYGLADPENLARFLDDPNPFATLADRNAPWLGQVISIAAILGIFSCFVAIHNTTVRVIFSMGRDRLLPPALGRVHPSWFSPYTAIYAQTAFTVIVGLVVGAWLGPGATGAYGWLGTVGTVAIVIVYMLSNIALIRFYSGRRERNTLLHVVVPVLGVLALAYPLWAVAQPGQDYPFNLVPILVLLWLLIGVAIYAYLRVRDPQRLDDAGAVLVEEGEDPLLLEQRQ
jgi:amino acid transporter